MHKAQITRVVDVAEEDAMPDAREKPKVSVVEWGQTDVGALGYDIFFGDGINAVVVTVTAAQARRLHDLLGEALSDA